MIHPLEIPLILEKVFAHLPLPQDRKNFRVVSQFWRDISVDEWRKSSVVRIINQRDWENFAKLFPESHPLGSYVNIIPLSDEPFHRFNEKPFCRYYLDGSVVLPPYHIIQWDLDVAKVEPKVRFFFERCGSIIEYLDLSDSVKFWNEEFAYCMRWILLSACVNLKELTIRRTIGGCWQPPYACQFQEENDVDDFKQETAEKLRSLRIIPTSLPRIRSRWDEPSVAELFNIAPNLESLQLNNLSSRVLESLKNPLRNGKYMKLQKLDVEVKEEHFLMLRDYFRAAKPLLTDFKMSLTIKDIRQGPQFTFHRLMVDIKATLNKLTLKIDWSDEEPFFIYDLTGHTFPNVTELNIEIKGLHRDQVPLKFDFRCLSGFPKLYKFHCIADPFYFVEKSLTKEQLYYNRSLDWNDRELNSLTSTITPLKYLKEFSFILYEAFDLDSLNIIAKCMPFVERLAIVTNGQSFPFVMDIWSLSLKRLILLQESSSIHTEMIESEEKTRDIKIKIINDTDKLAEMLEDLSIIV